jgi:hypothetical protein
MFIWEDFFDCQTKNELNIQDFSKSGDGIWIFQYNQEGKQELPEFSRPDMQ